MAKKKLPEATEDEKKKFNEKVEAMNEDMGTVLMRRSNTGKFLQPVGLFHFMKPMYSRCNRCPFAPKDGGDCDEYIEDADCSIEDSMFQIMVQSLIPQGVTDEDRMVLFPLIQKLFRLRRLYKLETEIDLRDYFTKDNEKFLENWTVMMKFINENEKGYMQFLKELRSTRKERTQITRGNKDTNTLNLHDLFAGLDEAEVVEENESTN